MDKRSYLDVAKEDLKFLEFYYRHLQDAPNYNPIVVQEQQIVEKLLKHMVDKYIDAADAVEMLRSHKIAYIARLVDQYCMLGIDIDSMRFLSDFYFDGRYPSRDYVIATMEDAKRGYTIVQEVYSKVSTYVSEHQSVTKLDSF